MPELFTHIPPLDDFETPVSGSTAASLSGFRNRVIIPSPQCTPSIPTRKPGFTCDECQQSFDTKHKLSNHRSSHRRPHRCEYPRCEKRFSRSKDLRRHQTSVHENQKFSCRRCGTELKARPDNMGRHQREACKPR